LRRYANFILGEMISTDLPMGFTVQRIGNTDAMAISHLPPSDIAEYLREHPGVAEALMSESSDKRFTPSSFIEQKGDRFRVGWFTTDAKYEFVQEFPTLADAAADYLLLSLGKGRWTRANERNDSINNVGSRGRVNFGSANHQRARRKGAEHADYRL